MVTLEDLNSEEFKKRFQYKVSICVTSYNQEKYIGTAIDSLLSQKTNFPFIIIVGDDYSTDDSRRILKNYEEKYSDKIKVLYHAENKGLFANRKEMFKYCDSEYIAFCDGDDYWVDDEVLQRKVDFLEKHTQYIGYQTGCYVQRGEEISSISDLEERNCFFDFVQDNALHNDYPGQVGGFFFRNIYKGMDSCDFEKYTSYKVDDSGKLPIVAGIIAPIYRQDVQVTFVYRHHEKSMERVLDKKNRCKDLFLSHLMYVDMVQKLFKEDIKMQIDNQLEVLVVNSFMTAVKSSCRSEREENWNQFSFLYNYGYFTKKQIRQFIFLHIGNKMREKLK